MTEYLAITYHDHSLQVIVLAYFLISVSDHYSLSYQ